MSAQRLTLTNLHWAAGFLEGEGCFSFAGKQLAVRAAQKAPDPLAKLQSIFGGYLTVGKNKIPVWNVSSADAAGIMMTLYSLMSPRRQGQIVVALNKWKSYGPVHLRGKHNRYNNSLAAERRRTGITRWEQDRRGSQCLP